MCRTESFNLRTGQSLLTAGRGGLWFAVSVPNKTDGLLGTITTTWNPSDDETSANTGPRSILYNDRPSGYQYERGGTGFNHAERVYPRRRYNSSNDPDIPHNAFNRGDLNPPMRDRAE